VKIEEIKKFHSPKYCVHVPWSSIESTLESYDDRGAPGWLGLNLDPDFQRGHVWTEDKQIAYVEFCLRNGEYSRTILFNHPNWNGSYKGEMVLVDGKQRIEAVRKFIRNQLPIFGGNFLNDFDNPKKLLRVDGAYFQFGVNNLKTNREVLEWYLQINSGGVVHTKEELEKVEEMLKKEAL
jgi:hypothetical protein